MTGILETILAELQAVRGEIAALRTAGGINVGTGGAGGLSAGQPTQPALLSPPPPPPPPPSNITGDQITALIQPHIGNETIKTALGAAMRGMGINALPETQPHQFAPLYAAFQHVIAQHTQQQPAPNGGGLSII